MASLLEEKCRTFIPSFDDAFEVLDIVLQSFLTSLGISVIVLETSNLRLVSRDGLLELGVFFTENLLLSLEILSLLFPRLSVHFG